ncbi:MAG: hypothetical protein GY869_28120 [Planctomycetes bacterium]|nr:hypothetical protein [Planctomycetota bacterium]
MPDFWMDVDVALAEVPVNIMPLIDDTDFKTRETGILYNSAGMDLVWNFTTTAGDTTQTAVTPTTSGDYDWANQGDGMYTLEIPASGGASINNDTEGFGWFTGLVTGVLPWRSPVIGFRAVALNNALIDGGDNLDVNTTQLGGSTQSATDLKDFADAGYDPTTNKVQGVVLVDTTTTNTDMVTEPPTAVQNRQEMDSNSTELAKIGTIPALDGAAQTIGGAIAKMADDNGGADFDAGTDSLQEIRDRGDVAWITGSGDATEAKQDTIISRIPVALVSGRMSSDAVAISGSTVAADNLEASALIIIVAAAAAGTLSTTQMTTTLTEATDDHYNGRIIIWTSGVLLGQATEITDYTGATKMLTFTAVTEAPSGGDTFIII